MSNLIAKEYKCFEDIKHIKEDGTEYWFARELAIVLDYNKRENFNKVIKRAMIACENSGHDITYDFPEVRKIVKAGATQKPVLDYELTRYACYLIVQNGDPKKVLPKLKKNRCRGLRKKQKKEGSCLMSNVIYFFVPIVTRAYKKCYRKVLKL